MEYKEYWILKKRQTGCSQVFDLDELTTKAKENLKSNFGDELIHVCEVPKSFVARRRIK